MVQRTILALNLYAREGAWERFCGVHFPVDRQPFLLAVNGPEKCSLEAVERHFGGERGASCRVRVCARQLTMVNVFL